MKISNKVLALALLCMGAMNAEGMISPPEFAVYYNKGKGGGHFELAPDGLEIKVSSVDKNDTLPTVCNEIATFAEKNHLHCRPKGVRDRIEKCGSYEFFQLMTLTSWSQSEIAAENARQAAARLAEEAEREERRRLAVEATKRGKARKEEKERRRQAEQARREQEMAAEREARLADEARKNEARAKEIGKIEEIVRGLFLNGYGLKVSRALGLVGFAAGGSLYLSRFLSENEGIGVFGAICTFGCAAVCGFLGYEFGVCATACVEIKRYVAEREGKGKIIYCRHMSRIGKMVKE